MNLIIRTFCIFAQNTFQNMGLCCPFHLPILNFIYNPSFKKVVTLQSLIFFCFILYNLKIIFSRFTIFIYFLIAEENIHYFRWVNCITGISLHVYRYFLQGFQHCCTPTFTNSLIPTSQQPYKKQQFFIAFLAIESLFLHMCMWYLVCKLTY